MKQMITRKALGGACALVSAVLLMGAADGSWLHRVSAADHARTNPLMANPEARRNAAAAGAGLYREDCAKCHGEDGGGLHRRPPMISARLAEASDGDLYWLLSKGNSWKGMPTWEMLPDAQRWQLVAYIRSLNLEDQPHAAAEAPTKFQLHSQPKPQPGS